MDREEILKKIIEDLSKKEDENNDNSINSDSENTAFFDKDKYYLINMKNLSKKIVLNEKEMLYFSEDINLNSFLQNIRNKKETKIVFSKIKNHTEQKNNKQNALVREDSKSQELYIDITLLTPDFVKNLVDLTNKIIASEKQKYEQNLEMKEELEKKKHRFKEFTNNCVKMAKKFLTVIDIDPINSVNTYFNSMNDNFGTKITITSSKSVNLRETFSSYKRDNAKSVPDEKSFEISM